MVTAERLLVFDILIPRTDDRTGLVRSISLFDEWTIETAERFGGLTHLAADVTGFWFDRNDLIEDRSHWFRIAVKVQDRKRLRDHVKDTALRFGQRCLYFQESGRAELVFPDAA